MLLTDLGHAPVPLGQRRVTSGDLGQGVRQGLVLGLASRLERGRGLLCRGQIGADGIEPRALNPGPGPQKQKRRQGRHGEILAHQAANSFCAAHHAPTSKPGHALPASRSRCPTTSAAGAMRVTVSTR